MDGENPKCHLWLVLVIYFFINLAREGAGEDVQKENAGEGPNFKMPCSHRSAGETKE